MMFVDPHTYNSFIGVTRRIAEGVLLAVVVWVCYGWVLQIFFNFFS